MTLLSEQEIKERLEAVPGWLQEGANIRKSFTFEDFTHALIFLNAVGHYAERANHHPDVEMHYNEVILSLSTHSAGGLTEKDFDLAEKIEGLVAR